MFLFERPGWCDNKSRVLLTSPGCKPWLQALGGGSPGCKPLCSHLHALAQQRNCGTSLAASRFARFGCKPFCWVTQARLQADPMSAHLQLMNKYTTNYQNVSSCAAVGRN